LCKGGGGKESEEENFHDQRLKWPFVRITPQNWHLWRN
jgi:hypothetical protein